MENQTMAARVLDTIGDLTQEEFHQAAETAVNPQLQEYLRCSAIKALAKTKDRNCYDLFLRLVEHEAAGYVRLDTLLALGSTRDSRALFPLVNYYEHADRAERERILMSLGELGDPRSLAFLETILSKEEGNLRDIAFTAYQRISTSSDTPFPYRFVGEESLRTHAKESEGAIHVRNRADLERNRIKIFNRLNTTWPQTYVILPNGALYLGGLVHEHVEAANGSDVIAAGELILDTRLAVTYANNRSNGYYPGKHSLKFLDAALDSLRLEHDSKTVEVFPREGFFDKNFLRMFPFYMD